MNASRIRQARILVVGVGGLGCPATLALARSGARNLTLIDDDFVALSNLHRQILYSDQDVGTDKLEAAKKALIAEGLRESDITLIHGRLLPDNAVSLAAQFDLIVEGADNFATKFLTADACHLAQRPVVHGAAVRWTSTIMAVPALGQPCYRCLFEDLPAEAPNCAEAGVVGPVLGIAGALMAEAALRIVEDQAPPFGSIFTIDGKADRVRQVGVRARTDCPLCGSAPQIRDVSEARYMGAACASTL